MVLPFGLYYAPTTFKRFIEKVLAGFSPENLQVYLDDVLIRASDFITSLRSFHLAISKIREAGLRLHSKNCKLLEITFLGHQVSWAGMRLWKGRLRQYGTPAW